MGKNKKIIGLFLIQTFLFTNAGFAGPGNFDKNHLIAQAALSPHIHINSDALIAGFIKQNEQAEALKYKDDSFILNNATNLLTCSEVSQVKDIIKQVIEFLGFGRVKFYEVTDYDPEAKKWYIRQEIGTRADDPSSARYIEEPGIASDEKEYVLNLAKTKGLEMYYDPNRWAHLIGDRTAQVAYVEPVLIAKDVQVLGGGKPQRVKEYLHIVLKNSKGDILGILSVDNWEKPLADNPDLSEPIFISEEDNRQKIKILKMFAQLSGLAMQRIDFKHKEQGINDLQESEQILREILHGIGNKIMIIRGRLTIIKSKEIKARVRESAGKISDLFKSLVLRVKGPSGNLRVDSVLRPGALLDRVLQVIEESVVIIRSRDPEKINDLFLAYEKQLSDEIRKSGNMVSPQQKDLDDFLDDFKKLAVYQSGLFDRREQLFLIHQKIQEAWGEIEKEIVSLADAQDNEIDPDMKQKLEDVFAAYQDAKIEYEKYINLCDNFTAQGVLQRTMDYQTVDINDLMKVINARWLRDELESSIRIESDLPKVIVDNEIFLSVFDELIMNAEKYGGASVAIDINFNKKQKDFLRIDFTTKGRGIPKEEWEKVFIDEYRVVKDDGLGTGLGLYAVRKNIERMGGKIAITKSVLQNDKQSGSTTFSIDIPVVNEASITKENFLNEPALEIKNINKNSLVGVSI